MMLRSSLLVSFAAFALFASGCSSSDTSAPTGQGTAGPATASEDPTAKNPYGVSYPTSNLGIIAREGNTAGNIIRNFKFKGYKVAQPGSAIAPGALEQVSLADYFDPESRNKSPNGTPYKILHITVSSVWCTPCNEETKEIVSVVSDLADKGVLFLTAIADGPVVGRGAEVDDLNGWVKKHKANYTHVLDPSLQNFHDFFDAAAVPFNADIDLRSMEILYGKTGAPRDITEHVTKWVKWTETNPAQGK